VKASRTQALKIPQYAVGKLSTILWITATTSRAGVNELSAIQLLKTGIALT